MAAIAKLPATNLILDGEATGVWNTGEAVGYHLFDILRLDERDFTPLPLDERRDQLQRLLLDYFDATDIGSGRSWSCRLPSWNGPRTANCVIHACSAYGPTRWPAT